MEKYRVFYKPKGLAEIHIQAFTNSYQTWRFIHELDKEKIPYKEYELIDGEWVFSGSHLYSNIITAGINSLKIPIIYHPLKTYS